MTQTNEKPETKYPEKILTDSQVVIDVSLGRWYSPNGEEEHAKRLEREAKDILEFIKDHRSMDVHNVWVERIYDYLCPDCGCSYERVKPDAFTCCDAGLAKAGLQTED